MIGKSAKKRDRLTRFSGAFFLPRQNRCGVLPVEVEQKCDAGGFVGEGGGAVSEVDGAVEFLVRF